MPEAPGIILAIPSRGSVRMEWAANFKMLEPPVNTSYAVRTILNEEVTNARNSSVQDALAQGAEYLIFIDDDVLVPNQGIRRMHYAMENNPDWDLLTGIYVTKSDPVQTLIFKDGKQGPYWQWKFGTHFPISGCGMGCCMIRMSAFEKVPEPWFEWIRKAEGKNHSEEGEDLNFCRKLKEAGGVLMADGGLLCGHIEKDGRIFSIPADSYPITNAEQSMVDSYTIIDASETLEPVA